MFPQRQDMSVCLHTYIYIYTHMYVYIHIHIYIYMEVGQQHTPRLHFLEMHQVSPQCSLMKQAAVYGLRCARRASGNRHRRLLVEDLRFNLGL